MVFREFPQIRIQNIVSRSLRAVKWTESEFSCITAIQFKRHVWRYFNNKKSLIIKRRLDKWSNIVVSVFFSRVLHAYCIFTGSCTSWRCELMMCQIADIDENCVGIIKWLSDLSWEIFTPFKLKRTQQLHNDVEYNWSLTYMCISKTGLILFVLKC